MTNFWRALETVYGYEGVAAMWRRRLGDDFDRIKTSLLTSTGAQTTSFPSAHICDCYLRVIKHAPDHIVGISDCGSTGCKDIALTATDIALLQLNEKKLSRAIVAALRCDAREMDLGIPGAKQIAVLGTTSMPIVLTLAQNRRAFTDVVRQLVLQLKEHFILLAPSSRFLDGNLHGLLKHAKAGFFPLDSILTLMPDGTLSAHKSAGELFSPMLPTAAVHEPQLLKSVAKAVEEIAVDVKLIAKGNYEWRAAKERLEAMQGENLFKFLQAIEAKDFQIICSILVHGDVAKASRVLDMRDSTVRDIVNGWKKRGGPYKGLAGLVEWRKRSRVTGTVAFNDNVLYEKNSETRREGIVADVLDGLLSMTENNWQDVCEELKEVLRAA